MKLELMLPHRSAFLGIFYEFIFSIDATFMYHVGLSLT